MDGLRGATLVCAVGTGIVGGFFYAFSVCVMRALAALPVEQGVLAMQTINVVVINPWFLTFFLGSCLPCGWLAVASLRDWTDSGSRLRLLGALLYLGGSFVVTFVCNVPRNDALAGLAPASVEAASAWAAYLSSWTAWNHVRALCSGLAAIAFTLAGMGAPARVR